MSNQIDIICDKKMNGIELCDLSNECLLQIFEFCNEIDLRNLSYVCQRFLNLIEQHIYKKRSRHLLMTGHHNNPSIMKRTRKILSNFERVTMGQNWLNGCYTEQEYCHQKSYFPNKLHLELDSLYISTSCYIRKHTRPLLKSCKPHEEAAALLERFELELCTQSNSDIVDYVKKNETVFEARHCGICYIHESTNLTEQRLHAPIEYLKCVDFAGEIYASSSNMHAKLWRRSEQFGLMYLDFLRDFQKPFTKMQFTENAHTLFAGVPNDQLEQALYEIDIESGVHKRLNSKVAFVYDLKIKDEHTILSGGHKLCMYDRRTQRDESYWYDPYDKSCYCLDYDGLYGIVCGSKYKAHVNLYDIRKPQTIVQMYFPGCIKANSICTPVQSIACDSQFLFTAFNAHVHVFNFKTGYNERCFKFLCTDSN